MNTLFSIASQFINGVTHITPLGQGLINDTYRVDSTSLSFVLQRINRTVFPRPEKIMANLSTLTEHIARKDSKSVKLQIPGLLNTLTNESFYQSENGDCWRAISYIPESESLETMGSIKNAEQVGFALGHFHRLVSDLEPSLLHDTLPGFHITPNYLKYYQQVLLNLTQTPNTFCTDFISRFEHITDDLEFAINQGFLSLRVIHGDPKLNNFLFDKQTRNIISIIDLDTVKPGLIHYDIGDCLRSCCFESDPVVSFNLEICAVLLKSYLSEADVFFSEHDYRYLYTAIRLIPFELGLRFYTDYLEGNRYFKVVEPEQNLQRAVNQFKLCASIMSQEIAIKALILESSIKKT